MCCTCLLKARGCALQGCCRRVASAVCVASCVTRGERHYDCSVLSPKKYHVRLEIRSIFRFNCTTETSKSAYCLNRTPPHGDAAHVLYQSYATVALVERTLIGVSDSYKFGIAYGCMVHVVLVQYSNVCMRHLSHFTSSSKRTLRGFSDNVGYGGAVLTHISAAMVVTYTVFSWSAHLSITRRCRKLCVCCSMYAISDATNHQLLARARKPRAFRNIRYIINSRPGKR